MCNRDLKYSIAYALDFEVGLALSNTRFTTIPVRGRRLYSIPRQTLGVRKYLKIQYNVKVREDGDIAEAAESRSELTQTVTQPQSHSPMANVENDRKRLISGYSRSLRT